MMFFNYSHPHSHTGQLNYLVTLPSQEQTSGMSFSINYCITFPEQYICSKSLVWSYLIFTVFWLCGITIYCVIFKKNICTDINEEVWGLMMYTPCVNTYCIYDLVHYVSCTPRCADTAQVRASMAQGKGTNQHAEEDLREWRDKDFYDQAIMISFLNSTGWASDFCFHIKYTRKK